MADTDRSKVEADVEVGHEATDRRDLEKSKSHLAQKLNDAATAERIRAIRHDMLALRLSVADDDGDHKKDSIQTRKDIDDLNNSSESRARLADSLHRLHV